jgi:uncharacterized protein with NRDE domain
MCLILFAYQHHPNYPLVLAANRDERFDRATRAAQFWPESPQLLAGKDLEAGGTWMGISRHGRFAAVTNFRGHSNAVGKLSRGQLCTDFLQRNISSRDYVEQVLKQASQYAGFNLLVYDGKNFLYCNNQNLQALSLQPGIYGLSNGLLDAPWPKIEKGKQGLTQILSAANIQSEHLLALLHDDIIADDHRLPATGVGLERERLLSPLFIRAGDQGYGTCNSTAVIIDTHQNVLLHERSFYQEPIQAIPNDQQFRFTVDKLT